MESALHENGWNSCSSGVAHFSFVAEEAKITAFPGDDKGPGWISRIDGHQSVGYMQMSCYGDFLITFFFIFIVMFSLPCRSLRPHS